MIHGMVNTYIFASLRKNVLYDTNLLGFNMCSFIGKYISTNLPSYSS